MKKWLAVWLCFCMLAGLTAGCKKPDPAPVESTAESWPESPATGPNGQEWVPYKPMINLIPDSTFSKDTEGWEITGNADIMPGKSRNSTDTKSLAFIGEGQASYILENVPAGTYRLSYSAYTAWSAVDALDSVVLVNGEEAARLQMVFMEWWGEYVTPNIQVPEGAKVEIRFAMEGGAEGEAYVDEVMFCRIPPAEEPYAGENPVSRLVKKPDGTYYVEVNGKPTTLRVSYAADSGGATIDQMASLIKEAGFNTFSYELGWQILMPRGFNTMDFRVVDSLLAAAEKYDMYVQLNWTGVMFCGAMMRTAPVVTTMHDLHSKKPGTDECEVFVFNGADGNKIEYCMPDLCNKQLLEIEGSSLQKLMDYLADHDTQRRVVGIQLENEAQEGIYQSEVLALDRLAGHMDYLAKIVKESRHPMICYVNSVLGASYLYNTKYIDINGTDFYSESIRNLNYKMETENSRIPIFPENGGQGAAPVVLSVLYANGGHVATYPVAADNYWGRPGLYGSGYSMTSITKSILNINTGVSKLGTVLALALQNQRVAFNHDDNGIVMSPREVKMVGNVPIGFESMRADAPTGIAVCKDNAVYVLADKPVFFTVFAAGASAETGYFDENDVWVKDKDLAVKESGEGFCVSYTQPGDLVKITCDQPAEEGVLGDLPSPEKPDSIEPTPVGVNLLKNYDFAAGLGEWGLVNSGRNPSYKTEGAVSGQYIEQWIDSKVSGYFSVYQDLGWLNAGTYTLTYTISTQPAMGDVPSAGFAHVYVNGELAFQADPSQIRTGMQTYTLGNILLSDDAQVTVVIGVNHTQEKMGNHFKIDMASFTKN